VKVDLTVNGTNITADVEDRMLLVHFLRDVADLTATNVGCDTTSCGACTVLLDGESVKSCTVLAAQASGHEVITLTNSMHRVNPFGAKVTAFPFHFDEPNKLRDSLRGVDTLVNTYWVRFDHPLFTHGQAVAIGMTYAAELSAQLNGFKQAERVVNLISRYGLPTYASFDQKKVFAVLKMDKKRERKDIHYILLEKIGKGAVQSVPLAQLEKNIQAL